jgi:hypothetical protein
MAKVKIDIAEVRKARKFLRQVNKYDYADIEWLENGIPVKISKDVASRMLKLGLNNVDILETQYRE